MAYALRVRSKEYRQAAACQFELATRLDREWQLRTPGSCAEVLPILTAQAGALGATIAALELVNVPAQRFVLERVPNRAARLAAALQSYHQVSK